MTRKDVDNMHRTAELSLQLELGDPGVRQGQKDFTVLSGLEVDMVLGGEVNPIVPRSEDDREC